MIPTSTMRDSPRYRLNEYGLREKDMVFLQQVFERLPALERAMLYGSRARHTHRLGSDIDLALQGASLTARDILRFQAECEANSSLLLRFDVVHYDTLDGGQGGVLKTSIDRDGVVVYERLAEEKKGNKVHEEVPKLSKNRTFVR
jgi:uncharacterized protein